MSDWNSNQNLLKILMPRGYSNKNSDGKYDVVIGIFEKNHQE